MTLTDLDETAACKRMQPTLETEQSPAYSSSSNVGVALREALWRAVDQGRLKTGVMECASLLEKDPFSVMMCVMPVAGPDDVTALIQRTLIEAFCHEYHIRLIKVDSVSKLDKVLEGRPLPSTDSPQTQTPPHPAPPSPPHAHTDGVVCVLEQRPGDGEEKGGTGKEGKGVGALVATCGSGKEVWVHHHGGIVCLPDD
ncbi:hypothetical protein ACOMHN_056001 [Nucella lapillus]